MDVLLERAKKQGKVKKHSFLKPHIIQLSGHALASVPRTFVRHIKLNGEGTSLRSEVFTQIVLEILDRHYLLTWQEWRHIVPLQPVPRRRIRRTKVYLKTDLKVEFITYVESKKGDGGQFYGDAQDFAEGPDGKRISDTGDRLNERAQKVEMPKHREDSGDVKTGRNGQGDDQVQDVGLDTPTILYFHGGGFCFGSVPVYRRWLWNCSRKLGGIRFLAVEYSLSPEATFPVALKQALDAYLWLTDPNGGGVSPLNVILGGDSAGGNLVASLLMLLRQMRIEKELHICDESNADQNEKYEIGTGVNKCSHSRVKKCLNAEEQIIDETPEQKAERKEEDEAEDTSADEETMEEAQLKMQMLRRKQSVVDLKQAGCKGIVSQSSFSQRRSLNAEEKEIRMQPTLRAINFDMELVRRHRIPFELDPDQKGRYPGMPLAAIQISPWVDLSEKSSVHSPDSWGRLKFRPYNIGVRFALAYLGLESPDPPKTKQKEKRTKRDSRYVHKLFRRRSNGEKADAKGSPTNIKQSKRKKEHKRHRSDGEAIELLRQESLVRMEPTAPAKLVVDDEATTPNVQMDTYLPRTLSAETEIEVDDFDLDDSNGAVCVETGDSSPETSPVVENTEESKSTPKSSTDIDIYSPYISPKYGDKRAFPPVFVSAGDEEPLLGDILRYFDTCKEAGVEAELFLANKVNHDYQFFFAAASLSSHPEISRYWAAAREWLMRQLQREIPSPPTSADQPLPSSQLNSHPLF